MHVAQIAGRQVGTGKREIGIRELLEWAFQREFASLDFDEVARETGARPGVGMEWIMMERGRLGCRVDGGGRSEPHHDADMVAGALAVLPEVYGGRRMAVQIAELARSGMCPDWMAGARPRCEPVGWKRSKYGDYAKTEPCRAFGMLWPADELGVKANGAWCPVMYLDTARDVAAARRRYLGWYGALMALRSTFQAGGHLTSFVVTDSMPVQQPWKKGLT
jgi:hypothetical protein